MYLQATMLTVCKKDGRLIGIDAFNALSRIIKDNVETGLKQVVCVTLNDRLRVKWRGDIHWCVQSL